MFVEFPRVSRQKVSLCLNLKTFRFRVYYRGYMVLMLTLWSYDESPLLWWSKPIGARHQKGKAVKVK